jgi:hypothetical protein
MNELNIKKNSNCNYSQNESSYYRNNSFLYDNRLMMESKKGDEPTIVEKLVLNNLTELGNVFTCKNRELIKLALNNLLSNIFIASDEDKDLAFPRAKRKFKNCTFYGLDYYRYSMIVNTMDLLSKLDFVTIKKGFYNKDKEKGEFSRVRATAKLLKSLDENLSDYSYPRDEEENLCKIHFLYGVKLNRRKFTNPIVLKDYNKDLLSYKPSKKTTAMQKFLNHYNDFIKAQSITILRKYIIDATQQQTYDGQGKQEIKVEREGLPSVGAPVLGRLGTKSFDYIELDCQLYRVFNNGKFTKGGRFYGAEYQSLNEQQRARILINGGETCEVDYSSFHARMLYHLEGMNCQVDPYTMVDSKPELRLLIKKMMQIIINAKSRGEAVGAFKNFLFDATELPDILSDHKLDAWKLSDMVIKSHKKIEKYFNTGIGVQLQYRDSKIAEAILKHFTRKKIVCLCIHDSFIVQSQYREELIEVMKIEYKKGMGFEGVVKVNQKQTKQ